jgi:DNA-directed RNA polymerase subunit omega
MANNKNLDGMRYPSVDDLLKKIDSKYKLAYVAARRARIIEEEDGYTAEDVDVKCVKPVGQALEEVLADKISIEFEAADSIFQAQTAEATDEVDNFETAE